MSPLSLIEFRTRGKDWGRSRCFRYEFFGTLVVVFVAQKLRSFQQPGPSCFGHSSQPQFSGPQQAQVNAMTREQAEGTPGEVISDLVVELLLRSFGSMLSVVALIPCIEFSYLSVAFPYVVYCSSPYWGLTPRSSGASVVACVLFSGFPCFSAGRGFDPAGGAPGGG
ncbi:hypothetical protein F511_30709 [Dorcoceras hygrometricum]|uniref:Uncharacterized protein n=1 Tax=Dorcoceras hygrometricum TaxID=472368 RepID=A0A2Z7B875_9LAMI|nr:hypothetical protein F511_30709 [Dorcoceras hygrometricum]